MDRISGRLAMLGSMTQNEDTDEAETQLLAAIDAAVYAQQHGKIGSGDTAPAATMSTNSRSSLPASQMMCAIAESRNTTIIDGGATGHFFNEHADWEIKTSSSINR